MASVQRIGARRQHHGAAEHPPIASQAQRRRHQARAHKESHWDPIKARNKNKTQTRAPKDLISVFTTRQLPKQSITLSNNQYHRYTSMVRQVARRRFTAQFLANTWSLTSHEARMRPCSQGDKDCPQEALRTGQCSTRLGKTTRA